MFINIENQIQYIDGLERKLLKYFCGLTHEKVIGDELLDGKLTETICSANIHYTTTFRHKVFNGRYC